MPKFVLDLTGRAVERLQILCIAYNQNGGLSLTLQDWMLLHLQEMAVAQELGAVMEGLRKQSEIQANQIFNDSIRSERARLISELGT